MASNCQAMSVLPAPTVPDVTCGQAVSSGRSAGKITFKLYGADTERGDLAP